MLSNKTINKEMHNKTIGLDDSSKHTKKKCQLINFYIQNKNDKNIYIFKLKT